jgi:iron complex outermembrane receptor protein
VRIAIIATAIGLSMVGLAAAGDAQAAISKPTNIPAQGLGPALQTLAKDRDFQVLYRTEVVGDLRTRGAVGTLTSEEALRQLLSGTGLTYRFLDDKTVTIVPVPSASSRVDGSGIGYSMFSVADQDSSAAPDAKASFSGGFRLAQAGQGSTSAAEVQTQQPAEIQAITVTAAKVRALDQFTPTGSRLGLTALETPGSLDVIDSDEMLGRGFSSVEQAADSLPGVTSGGSPGDLEQFSMRGFTGDQILSLYNGLYIGPANITNRPQNTFNLESVEILKGPASVLYGQGAVAGAVNVVSKGPRFGASGVDLLASSGSFGNTSLGIGGTTQLNDTLAVRVDLSRTSTNGYVRGASADSTNGTATVLWRPSANFDAQFTLDYLEDNPSRYFGTPLVPVSFATQPLKGVIDPASGLAIDQRMRFVNYNVADSSIHSSQYWPQLLLKWTPNESLTIRNFSYYFHAHRRWIDAETYAFDAATQLIDRDRFFVFHRQNLFGDQIDASLRGKLFGLSNTFVLGADYSHLNFVRDRGFPAGDAVDPFNPSPGLFGPIVPRQSPTRWNDYALFFEDALDVTTKLKLVTGGRYDQLELDRQNYDAANVFDPTTSFTRTFKTGNFRIGAVYKLNDDVTPYVSWTTGADPVGTDIILVNSSENFSLARSSQIEAGVKAKTAGGGADGTVAIYSIDRKNILTQTTIDTVSNIGDQKSRGIEISGDFKLMRNWSVSGNAAYTDSFYGLFVDTNTGLNANGHQPADIPRWTANLWTSVRDLANLPLELGGGIRYVGRRFANTQNSVALEDYALVDFYASFRLKDHYLLTARVNNAFDKAYAQWADVYYPTEIMLGQPRNFSVSLVGKF